MIRIRGREYDQQVTQRHSFDRVERRAGEALGFPLSSGMAFRAWDATQLKGHLKRASSMT